MNGKLLQVPYVVSTYGLEPAFDMSTIGVVSICKEVVVADVDGQALVSNFLADSQNSRMPRADGYLPILDDEKLVDAVAQLPGQFMKEITACFWRIRSYARSARS